MAGPGTLVAGLVHEIATPVGTIRSNTDVGGRALGKLDEILALDAAAADTTLLLHTLLEAQRGNDTAVDRLRVLLESLRTFTHLDRAPVGGPTSSTASRARSFSSDPSSNGASP